MSDQPAVVFEQEVFRVLQPSGTTVINVEDTTTPEHVKDITQDDILNWNEAYSWGDHASVGYLTNVSLNGYATQSWVGQNYQPIGDYVTVGGELGDITLGDITTGNITALGNVAARTIYADGIVSMVYRSNVNGRAGFVFGSGNNILPTDYRGAVTDGFVDLGMVDGRYKDGWFGGTVNATSFVGDGSGLTNLQGSSVTDDNDNVVIGTDTLGANTTGFRNMGAGVNSLAKNTTGAYNTATGYGALDTNITGRNNSALGAFADVGAPDLTNATAIGYGAIAGASNTIQLGDANVTLVNTAGAVQAADYLDADGNSIIGSGGGAVDFPISFDIFGSDVSYVYSDEYPAETIRPSIVASPLLWSARFLPTTNPVPNEIYVDRNNLNIKTGRSALLLGPSEMAVKAGNCQITLNDRDDMPHITAESLVEGDTLTFRADIFEANDYRDLDGNSLVGLFAMDFAHSFTKLQQAVRDETTIEGVKDALVNALGGLIEEFEHKAKEQ